MGFDEPYEIAALNDALVRVRLLASSPVANAAEVLTELLPGYTYGGRDRDQLNIARKAFVAAARTDLGGPGIE